MPKRITDDERRAVLALLAQGHDRDTISALVGVTPGQVSAISAHVKMGTYELPDPATTPGQRFTPAIPDVVADLNDCGRACDPVQSIPLGKDVESGESVCWNPDPATGSVNPHVLILGESGFGKTYTISCLLAELAHRGIHSVVFDYGQGFSPDAIPPEFTEWVQPTEINASRDGVDVNPLQIFPTDILGPVNVAQRVSDTFTRVYTKLGVQQHAVLRQAVLDVFSEHGIDQEAPDTWLRELPSFKEIYEQLQRMAANPLYGQSGVAATVASHISTMFVFNTFRSNGLHLAWPDIFRSDARTLIVHLNGLEYSLECAVTEFLLWNLVGYIESNGPSPLQCFVVLDEAHRLSFDRNSPVEKLLREGRKFGLGLILASQQPQDFSPTAFGNSATKIVFQTTDDSSTVSRQLSRKNRSHHSFADIHSLITRLPRGVAFTITDNIGHVVQIHSFADRMPASE